MLFALAASLEFAADFKNSFSCVAFSQHIPSRLINLRQQQVQLRQMMPFVQLHRGLRVHFGLGKLIEVQPRVRRIIKRIRIADWVDRQGLIRKFRQSRPVGFDGREFGEAKI